MSWLLLIESSIRGVGVGLTNTDSKDLKWSCVFSDVNDSAKQLPSLVKNGLTELKLSVDDLGGIVTSAGPGSFTGLRVGASYSYGLAEGLNTRRASPLLFLGTSSLKLIFQNRFKSSKNAVILPSTKTTGYIVSSNADGVTYNERSFDITKENNWLDYPEIAIIGTWPGIESVFKNSQIKDISFEDAINTSLHEMAKTGGFNWDHGFSSTLPELNYLKKSSVEELADKSNS